MDIFKSRVLFGVILIIFISSPAVVLAKDSQKNDTGPYITGFADIPWGANEKTIKEEYGSPVTTMKNHTSHPNGPSKSLAYKDTLLNETVYKMFLVRKKEGLIKGFYSVQLDRNDNCETVFDKFSEAITGEYDQLESETMRRNGSSSLDFCNAVRIGEAGKATTITDPSNGTSIAINLFKSADTIKIHYETPIFSKISEENKKAQAKTAF